MKKHFAFFVLSLIVIACKSKKNNPSFAIDSSVSTKEIIEKHISKNSLDFQTLHIKGKTSYSVFNINLDIRIKKSEIIWISARVPLFGNVAKVKITTDSVHYHSNYFKEYFQGDYVFLSDWSGVELDFDKVQNILLGRTLEKIDIAKTNLQIENNNYKTLSKKNDLLTTYFFEPEHFSLAKQSLEQPKTNRKAVIEYSKYKTQNNINLPYRLLLFFIENNKNENTLEVEYKNVELNTELSFPYEIPTGYREIEY